MGKYPNITTGNMALNKVKIPIKQEDKLESDISNNTYSKLLFDLYNATYFPKCIVHSDIKRHFGMPFSINLDKYNAICAINDKVDAINKESPTFDELFEYGTFIKILEKVFLYRNDKDSKFVCDSNMSDNNHRVLVMQSEAYFIKLHVEKRDTGNTIEVTIDRLYGRKMTNSYTIIDRKFKDPIDDTDIVLMNNINHLLQYHMTCLLVHYAQMIADEEIEDNFIRPSSYVNNKKYVVYSYTFLDPDSFGMDDFKKPMWYKDLKWYVKNVLKIDTKKCQCFIC
jgi:hypothetical protein